MTAQNDFEQTFALGKQALGYMKYNATPAIPPNYELWYSYAAGTNQTLITAIKEILDNENRVSPEEVARLYDLYISPTRLSEQAEFVSGQISEEIKEIVSILRNASKENGSFGQTLEEVGQSLNEVPSEADLKVLVQRLITETANAEKNTKVLQKQLEDSQKEIREMSANLEAIRTESITDQLTRLPNRKHFDETIEAEVRSAQETGEPLCVMLADIDHFKKFNDTYGHQTGDQVLRLVAYTMKENVKGRDLASRYGGEEFAIILPATNLENAIKVGNNVRVAVQQRELVKKSTNTSLGRVTISIGIAQYQPGENISDLIHRADACLYAAKGAGRNQVKCETDSDIDLNINAA